MVVNNIIENWSSFANIVQSQFSAPQSDSVRQSIIKKNILQPCLEALTHRFLEGQKVDVSTPQDLENPALRVFLHSFGSKISNTTITGSQLSDMDEFRYSLIIVDDEEIKAFNNDAEYLISQMDGLVQTNIGHWKWAIIGQSDAIKFFGLSQSKLEVSSLDSPTLLNEGKQNMSLLIKKMVNEKDANRIIKSATFESKFVETLVSIIGYKASEMNKILFNTDTLNARLRSAIRQDAIRLIDSVRSIDLSKEATGELSRFTISESYPHTLFSRTDLMAGSPMSLRFPSKCSDSFTTTSKMTLPAGVGFYETNVIDHVFGVTKAFSPTTNHFDSRIIQMENVSANWYPKIDSNTIKRITNLYSDGTVYRFDKPIDHVTIVDLIPELNIRRNLIISELDQLNYSTRMTMSPVEFQSKIWRYLEDHSDDEVSMSWVLVANHSFFFQLQEDIIKSIMGYKSLRTVTPTSNESNLTVTAYETNPIGFFSNNKWLKYSIKHEFYNHIMALTGRTSDIGVFTKQVIFDASYFDILKNQAENVFKMLMRSGSPEVLCKLNKYLKGEFTSIDHMIKMYIDLMKEMLVSFHNHEVVFIIEQIVSRLNEECSNLQQPKQVDPLDISMQFKEVEAVVDGASECNGDNSDSGDDLKKTITELK
jgi:hypothetical protein